MASLTHSLINKWCACKGRKIDWKGTMQSTARKILETWKKPKKIPQIDLFFSLKEKKYCKLKMKIAHKEEFCDQEEILTCSQFFSFLPHFNSMLYWKMN